MLRQSYICHIFRHVDSPSRQMMPGEYAARCRCRLIMRHYAAYAMPAAVFCRRYFRRHDADERRRRCRAFEGDEHHQRTLMPPFTRYAMLRRYATR